jgi:hypothetical protein
MRSNINAAWSAENRRQVRSVQLYRWLDDLQALAHELLRKSDPHLATVLSAEGMSVATLEAHMPQDCFPALLLWHLLQTRSTFEQNHVTDVGAAFSRLLQMIAAQMCDVDAPEVPHLQEFFSKSPGFGGVSSLRPSAGPKS